MSIENEFLELFHGFEEVHGCSKLTGEVTAKGKREATSWTEAGPATAQDWQKHLAGTAGVGIAPLCKGVEPGQEYIRFGAIDIDDYQVDIKLVESKIRQAGLPLVVCSTKSNGIHAFLFGAEDLPAEHAREKLHDWAAFLGYPGVEVFPKQHKFGSDEDVGNWINMPYFAGERTSRFCVREGNVIIDPSEFITYAKSMRVTWEQIEAVDLPVDEPIYRDGPVCLETMTRNGIAEGHRNKALFAFGVFLKKAYPETWEDELDKVNQKYFTPPLGHKEVVKLVKSLNKKDYHYTCREQPLCNLCDRELCLKRKYGVGSGAADPGISLTTMTKIDTSPPVWLVGVNGHVMALSTEELMSQIKFQKRVIEESNIWPRTVKSKDWHDLIQGVLSKAEIQDAPNDASVEGQLLVYLEDFCYSRAQGRSEEDLLTGLAWQNEGRIYFRSTDFLRYLDQNRALKLPQNRIWTLLKQHGAQHHRMRIKGKLGSFWSVPDLEHQTEPFDTPDLTNVSEF